MTQTSRYHCWIPVKSAQVPKEEEYTDLHAKHEITP